MTRNTLTSLAGALALTLSSTAQADPVLDCLSQAVEVSEGSLYSIDERLIRVDVTATNRSEVAFSGLHVEVAAHYPGRPTPLASRAVTDFITLGGALLPGERAMGRVAMHIDPRIRGIVEDEDQLTFSVTVQNVAGAGGANIAGQPKMASWPDDELPLRSICPRN